MNESNDDVCTCTTCNEISCACGCQEAADCDCGDGCQCETCTQDPK